MALTLERYAKFCAPAAVASAMGTTRLDAATALREASAETRRGWTSISGIARALGSVAEEVRKEDGAGRWAGARQSCPTLTRWLKDNSTREAILRASHHFIHVRNGQVIESNGWTPKRGRVTHVIWLDQ